MKKILSKMLTFVFVIVAIFSSAIFLSSCGSSNDEDLTIKNYSDYISISAGIENSNYSASNKVKTMSSSNQKPQLIGQRKDGTFEKIKFVDDKKIEASYGIRAIQNLGDFVLIQYYKYESGETISVYDTICFQPARINTYITFALNKTTGKMFNITKYAITAGAWQSQFGCSECIANCYGYASFDNGFYAVGHKYLTNEHCFILKFTQVNDELEVKEVVDTQKLNTRQFFSDKYGNLFDTLNNRMITAQGILKKDISSDVKLAMNGIAYLGNQWFNAQGELEEATFVPENFINPTLGISSYYYEDRFYGFYDLITKDGQTEYYRMTRSQDNQDKIYKFTFTNEIEYSVEIITLEKYEKNDNGLIMGNKLYFLNNNEVYYVNIDDGTSKTLSSNYAFSKIYTDNQGNVIFEGLDENLNDITGIINSDDSIKIGVTPKKYNIYYIEAIN